jgi:Holliday junction resolvase RusA-like endonuclease
MIELKIKPLSVNECWQGKRFKTPKYNSYERAVILMLPKLVIPQKPLKLILEFGFSNSCSDWDNAIKPFQDILVKKYDFDDRDIYQAEVRKTKVVKGAEFVRFEILSLGAPESGAIHL